MEALEEEDDERFKKQFSTYLADGIGSEDIEEMYTAAYAAIREDPSFTPTEKTQDWKSISVKHQDKPRSYDERKAAIAQKIAAWNDARAAMGGEESEAESEE